MGMRNIAAAFLLGLCALAGHAATYESAIDITFPDEIGGLPFVGRKEFPSKELGFNLGYQSDQLRGSIFVYNGGLRSIPPGADSEVVRRHFAQVIGEVKELESLGRVHSITFVDPAARVTSYPGCGPQFLFREFVMALSEADALSSFTYLTAVNGNFVKLRVSYRKSTFHGKQDVERFVTQLRKVLGKCPVG